MKTLTKSCRAPSSFLIFLPAIVVLTSTWAFFTFFPHYKTDSNILTCDFDIVGIADNSTDTYPSFRPTLKNNSLYITNSGGISKSKSARLTPLKAGNTARLTFDVSNPREYSYLHVSAFLKSANLTPGEKKWQGGQFDLFFYGNNGKIMWERDRKIVKLLGDTDWMQYQKTFKVPLDAKHARLTVSNSGSSGDLFVDNVKIFSTRLNQTFFEVKKMMGIVLAVTAISYLLFFIQSINLPVKIYVLALLIFAGTVAPNSAVYDTAQFGISLVQTFVKRNDQPEGRETERPRQQLPSNNKKTQIEDKASRTEVISFVKKGGHIGLFSGMGFLLGWWLRQKRQTTHHTFIFGLSGLVLFACFTEIAQFFSATRTPHFHDLILDFSGLLIGYLVAWGINRKIC